MTNYFNYGSFHARSTDPATSHEAIPRNLAAQCYRVLRGYRDGVARTDHDAYHLVGMTEGVNGARQRCTDLRHAGYIVRAHDEDGYLLRGRTPSGKTGYLCHITPDGRAYLQQQEAIRTNDPDDDFLEDA